MNRRIEEERGAVAVLVALLAVALFGFAALAVDLSNAFVRTRDVQRQADFAALAGGSKLGSQTSGAVPAAVVDAVRDQLNGPGDMNLPQDDGAGGRTPVTSTELTNGDLLDGEVRFANGGLQVIAPEVRVNYSFAQVLGADPNVDVSRDATVGVFSPGTGVMPVYAVNGCDWGSQTITDPASGADPAIPPLAYDSDGNATTLETLADNEVALNASGVQVTLSGKDFTNITKVGFFRADDTSDGAIVTVAASAFDPPADPAIGFSKNGSGSIGFEIPTLVSSVETAWYVRVFEAGTVNKWSKRDESQPLRVGEAVLECASLSSDGNFGTLKLPRLNPNSDAAWIPVNIAAGLEAPLRLAIHETPAADGLCTHGLNGAVVSVKPNLRPGTNCVDTDTGLPANVATDGLVLGHSGYPGRLRSDTSMCGPGGSTDPRTLPISSNPKINNDVLTCFMTNSSTSLAAIASPAYTGGAVFTTALYDSPRFFWQPVLKTEPDSGGSNTYSIVDFRPGFITDEVVASSTLKGTNTASADNGLTVQGNDIKQIKVVFFSDKALPADDNGQVLSPYLGVGPRILRLID